MSSAYSLGKFLPVLGPVRWCPAGCGMGGLRGRVSAGPWKQGGEGRRVGGHLAGPRRSSRRRTCPPGPPPRSSSRRGSRSCPRSKPRGACGWGTWGTRGERGLAMERGAQGGPRRCQTCAGGAKHVPGVPNVCRGCPPDGLVGDPAGIALLVAAQVGSIQLLGGGDAGTDPGTSLLRLGEGVGVAHGALAVVKHNPWGQEGGRGWARGFAAAPHPPGCTHARNGSRGVDVCAPSPPKKNRRLSSGYL